MKIDSVHLRRFRGLEQASVENCTGLNVLIGRNNAGKSSVIAAIETALTHLSEGQIASIWETRNRPVDEFTRRDVERPLQIGISFKLSQNIGDKLREKILSSGSGLDLAVKQLESASVISVIIAAQLDKDDAIIYVQQIGLGTIDASSDTLSISENRLFLLPDSVAVELADRERSIAKMRGEIRAIDRMDRGLIEFMYRNDADSSRTRRFREIGGRNGFTPSLRAKISQIVDNNDTLENFEKSISQLKSSYDADIEEVEGAPLKETIPIFSGNVYSIPDYVKWILLNISNGDVLTFKEIRNAIGREEANQILKLKTKRGGAEALARVQRTVKSLLGVQVDAFEPEGISSNKGGNENIYAEMDVDDFLVEANGAGIREALRIILDLELKNPSLAFVEEPEVHLHPGLEKILHNYLVGKSNTIQLFIATHSANFLDASARQNVYLVSRNSDHISNIQKVASEGDLLKISDEVGLKPSTVLMFDRLVFVEGPSDEDILTVLSRKLGLDITASSTAFVQMGGASRFAHYAAQATLELLSRRQIKMWFVIDQDERDDTDVTNLLNALGNRAELTFLGRREIENYILFPEAVHSLLLEKLASSKSDERPSLEDIDQLILSSAQDLLERAVELRLTKTVLKPVYAQYGGKNVRERLSAMRDAISGRINTVDTSEAEIRAELTRAWERNALQLAPGSAILDAVFTKFGCRYKKAIDGRRLAELINTSELDSEIVKFLKKISSTS